MMSFKLTPGRASYRENAVLLKSLDRRCGMKTRYSYKASQSFLKEKLDRTHIVLLIWKYLCMYAPSSLLQYFNKRYVSVETLTSINID